MEQWKVKYSNNLFTLQRVERGAGLYDYDGRSYGSVVIGSQEWLVDNYSPLHYANGNPILHLPGAAEWQADVIGGWCYYNNDQSYLTYHGRLYNQYAVKSPDGFVYLERNNVHETDWRVPSDVDYEILAAELGGINIAGGKMKTPGTTYWFAPNIGATNSSGFTARGSGVRDANGVFGDMMITCNLWTTLNDYSYIIEYGSSVCMASILFGDAGASVRLVRDI